jgi:hypothetical protein
MRPAGPPAGQVKQLDCGALFYYKNLIISVFIASDRRIELESRKLVSRVLLLSLAALLFAVPALGQANANKGVIYIGGSYNMALVEDAENGFFGIDLSAAKMMNNNISLGFAAGYDVVHYYKYTVESSPEEGGGDFTERLAVLPILVKGRYYFSFSRMAQLNVSLAGGVYNTISKLGGNSVGGISGNETEFGGSIGVGFDYWFLLTTGVSFEFEYHMFTTPGDADMFTYWQARVNYGIIKF